MPNALPSPLTPRLTPQAAAVGRSAATGRNGERGRPRRLSAAGATALVDGGMDSAFSLARRLAWLARGVRHIVTPFLALAVLTGSMLIVTVATLSSLDLLATGIALLLGAAPVAVLVWYRHTLREAIDLPSRLVSAGTTTLVYADGVRRHAAKAYDGEPLADRGRRSLPHVLRLVVTAKALRALAVDAPGVLTLASPIPHVVALGAFGVALLNLYLVFGVIVTALVAALLR